MELMYVNEAYYRVLRLLGHGKGGYSYLVTDGKKQYVLKQIHHEPCDYYQFGDKLQAECRDYQRLHQLGLPLPVLFALDAANERILKQYIHGETIATLVARDQMKPEYFTQIEQMCRVLYAAGLNIDYYPTNFVVQDDILYYIDYECNVYQPEWSFEQWGRRYWIPQQPEA